MVAVGLAITVAPVVVDKPVDGLQLYVLAPFAVRLTEDPWQMAADGGVMVITGGGVAVTATTTLAVFTQPFDPVPVTVYVVVAVGLAATTAVLVEESPVAGLQL